MSGGLIFGTLFGVIMAITFAYVIKPDAIGCVLIGITCGMIGFISQIILRGKI